MILSYIFQNSGRPSESLEKCPSRPLKKHSQKVLLLVCKIYRNEVWQNRTHLNCITKICWKMIGHPVRALSTSCEQQTRRILQDPSHLLHSVFEWFPSGRGLCCAGCRKQRRRVTFLPTAVQLRNCDLFLLQYYIWIKISDSIYVFIVLKTLTLLFWLAHAVSWVKEFSSMEICSFHVRNMAFCSSDSLIFSLSSQ